MTPEELRALVNKTCAEELGPSVDSLVTCIRDVVRLSLTAGLKLGLTLQQASKEPDQEEGLEPLLCALQAAASPRFKEDVVCGLCGATKTCTQYPYCWHLVCQDCDPLDADVDCPMCGRDELDMTIQQED